MRQGAKRGEPPSRRIAGADGCSAGWIWLTLDLATGELDHQCVGSARELLALTPQADILAIDVPIGLPDAGPRECDLAARRLLGRGRAASVFTAPIRAVLEAQSWEEACRIREQVEGKRMSRQAWNIVPRIREVDALLRARRTPTLHVREVHPEVSFAVWQGAPLVASKKSPAGLRLRRALVDGYFGRAAYAEVRADYPVSRVASDDILDAFAALWTAERIARGLARSLPAMPPEDRAGLPMAIVY